MALLYALYFVSALTGDAWVLDSGLSRRDCLAVAAAFMDTMPPEAILVCSPDGMERAWWQS